MEIFPKFLSKILEISTNSGLAREVGLKNGAARSAAKKRWFLLMFKNKFKHFHISRFLKREIWNFVKKIFTKRKFWKISSFTGNFPLKNGRMGCPEKTP